MGVVFFFRFTTGASQIENISWNLPVLWSPGIIIVAKQSGKDESEYSVAAEPENRTKTLSALCKRNQAWNSRIFKEDVRTLPAPTSSLSHPDLTQRRLRSYLIQGRISLQIYSQDSFMERMRKKAACLGNCLGMRNTYPPEMILDERLDVWYCINMTAQRMKASMTRNM